MSPTLLWRLFLALTWPVTVIALLGTWLLSDQSFKTVFDTVWNMPKHL